MIILPKQIKRKCYSEHWNATVVTEMLQQWLKYFSGDWNVTVVTEMLQRCLKCYSGDWNATADTEMLQRWLKIYSSDWNATVVINFWRLIGNSSFLDVLLCPNFNVEVKHHTGLEGTHWLSFRFLIKCCCCCCRFVYHAVLVETWVFIAGFTRARSVWVIPGNQTWQYILIPSRRYE